MSIEVIEHNRFLKLPIYTKKVGKESDYLSQFQVINVGTSQNNNNAQRLCNNQFIKEAVR